MLKQQIAARLEQAFSQYGFTELSVAQLKIASQVSLRTLYKHYPSKEEMTIGALTYRHQRYLNFLQQNSPVTGIESVIHIFKQLDQWMKEYAPHGCMSINAIAAFPDNDSIQAAVKQHKEDVRQFLGQQSQREDLSTQLFILHEGISSAWPLLGAETITSALQMVKQLMEKNS